MSLSGLARSVVVSRVAAIVFAIACLALMSGCPVKSLNGLGERDNDPDMVFDSRLVGTWHNVGQKCTSTDTITAHEKVFDWQVVDCESNNKRTSYEARLFKLDQHYFLDMTARSEDVCDLCVSIHLISLVRFEKDSFMLLPIDYDWFKNAVQNKSVSLATLPDAGDTVTASPKDLKAFCREHADDNAAFKPDPDLVFKRQ